MDTEYVTFDDSLGDEDWGLILDSEGQLKGLFIPKGKEDDVFPQKIVDLCMEAFGIDITEDGEEIPVLLHQEQRKVKDDYVNSIITRNRLYWYTVTLVCY